jgi:hypothetical protein
MEGVVRGQPELDVSIVAPLFRECSFQLCVDDGSVYMDFQVTDESDVRLLRVSFDGYGCCSCASSSNEEGSRMVYQVTPMSASDATALHSMIQQSTLEQPQISDILRRYCTENRQHIWDDALEEYGLLLLDQLQNS